MATGTVASEPVPPPIDGDAPEHDDYIVEQLSRTQTYVKAVDLSVGLLKLFVVGLAYLLLVSILDHWVIHGGLGFWGRMIAFAGLLAGAAVYLVRAVVPYLRYRINPVYAARTIEEAEPSLKNSLVNFLLLRQDHRGVPEVVFQGLREEAATKLSHLPVETAVDRSSLIRLGYVLIAVVVACGLYEILLPKEVLPSFARVLLPTADIDPPMRVKITGIAPGNVDALRRQQLPITAKVSGLEDNEQVTLYYSSEDGRTDRIAVPMFRPEGKLKHQCLLPPETAGLVDDLVYHIEAGDAVSKSYSIHVLPAPSIVVESVEYHYPRYTGWPSRTVKRLGDIKALEGTRIVVRGRASQPIETGHIKLEGPQTRTVNLTAEGALAQGSFRLKMSRASRVPIADYDRYALHFENARGDKNANPIVYRIETTPDKPPRTEILSPQEDEVELALDGELFVEIRGGDADFALSALRLEIRRNHERDPLAKEPLLEHEEKPWKKTYRTIHGFAPAKYPQVQPGDVVVLRAVAEDNRTPKTNQDESRDVRVRILAPVRSEQQRREEQQEQEKKDRGKQRSEEAAAMAKEATDRTSKAVAMGSRRKTPSQRIAKAMAAKVARVIRPTARQTSPRENPKPDKTPKAVRRRATPAKRIPTNRAMVRAIRSRARVTARVTASRAKRVRVVRIPAERPTRTDRGKKSATMATPLKRSTGI